jgi:RNA polymerase sigma-70 factor (ECF subfamily)
MEDLYLKKIIEGNTDSFRYFIRKYKDKGYSLAMSVVNNEYQAEEVLQTAFIKAYSGLKSFKGNSKFSTWFYRILINEAFKSLKKQGNNYSDIEPFSGKLQEKDYFQINADEEDQKYYINEALKRIHSNESLALRLFYLEECTIEEITEITGWSCSNVKVILHRGRHNMKTILKKLFESDKAMYHERY